MSDLIMNKEQKRETEMKTDFTTAYTKERYTESEHIPEEKLCGKKRSRSPSSFESENTVSYSSTDYGGTTSGPGMAVADGVKISSLDTKKQSESPSSSSKVSSILGEESKDDTSEKKKENLKAYASEALSTSNQGIYDDAEESESSLHEAPNIPHQQQPIPPAPKPSESPVVGSDASQGGIFDDADEDETYDIEALNFIQTCQENPIFTGDTAVAAQARSQVSSGVIDLTHENPRMKLDPAGPPLKLKKVDAAPVIEPKMAKLPQVGSYFEEPEPTLSAVVNDETMVDALRDKTRGAGLRADLGSRYSAEIDACLDTVDSSALSISSHTSSQISASLSKSLESEKKPKKQGKKKKAPKPARKVLMNKKDQDAAEGLLMRQIDLAKILPMEDCKFLGRELWIFTLQQLEYVLEPSKVTGGDADTPDSRDHRRELLNKLASGSFLKDHRKGKNFTLSMNDLQNSEKGGSERVGVVEHRSFEAEEDRICTWKKAIEQWKESGSPRDNFKKSFSLKGPLKFLFPKCVRNFARSAGIKTAYDFMCLKRTETGSVVDMYRIWRERCGLRETNALALAKTLLGIGARIEAAIGSFPPIDSHTRAWMSEPLVVLTGAAKDFVITECKILQANEFVARQTKDMADNLAVWRESKGLPILKGTGKVAMISSWKTQVKEALEIESQCGKVLEGIDLVKEAEKFAKEELEAWTKANESIKDELGVEDKSNDKGALELKKNAEDEKKDKPETKKKIDKEESEQKESKKKAERPPKAKSSLEAEAALESSTFLSTILDDDTVLALESSGIKTARDLRNAEKTVDSPSVQALIAMRKQYLPSDDNALKAESCVRLVTDWCSFVESKLKELSGRKSEKKSKKRKHQETSSGNGASPNGEIGVAEKPSRVQKTALSKDPFDYMSSTTKVFLKSAMGICTAEAFLAARTTDIANAFIKYREQKGMTPLKGLGAVASVSSWKALCRKAAAKNSGNEQDTSMMPNKKTSVNCSLDNEPKTAIGDVPSSPLKIPDIKELSDKSVLFGFPTKRFGVHGAGGNTVYQFELSLRRSSLDKSKSAIHLTYLGSCTSAIEIAGSEKDSLTNLSFGAGMKCTRVVVLQHATKLPTDIESKEPFWSIKEGGGTFEISRFGVNPLRNTENNDEIKDAIQTYVSCEASDSSNSNESFLLDGDGQSDCNVIELVQPNKEMKYFPIFHRQIEVGQTLELRFPSNRFSLNESVKNSDTRLRSWIKDRISSMSPLELRSLLDYLNDIIGAAVYPLINNAVNYGSDLTSTYIKQLVISRRRIHWVAMSINSRLKAEFSDASVSVGSNLPSVALTPLWTFHSAKLLQRLPLWEDEACPALHNEIEDEILSSFNSMVFGKTRRCWCPFAEKLFLKSISLFAEYATTLDSQRLVADFQAIGTNEASRLKRLRLATQEFPDDAAMYGDLVLRYKKGATKYAEFFPPDTKLPPKVVASQGTNPIGIDGGDRLSKVVMQPIQEFSKNTNSIHFKWYVEFQILAVVNAAVTSGVIHVAQESNEVNEQDLLSKVLEAVRSVVQDSNVNFPDICKDKSDVDPLLRTLPPLPMENSSDSARYTPNTFPFFLSLIWPAMRTKGWKLEAGLTPSDVLILPPGKDLKTRRIKSEASQHRAKLARTANGVGLGYVPKLSKRLLVKCSEPIVKFRREKFSVSQGLAHFKRHYANNYSGGEKTPKKVIKIMKWIETLFEELAPRLCFKDEADRVGDRVDGKLSEILGCEFLMRLLLVIPGILEQCDLSVQQVRDTKGVVRELMNYLSSHHRTCFHKSLHLDPEEYVDEEMQIPSFLKSRLRHGGRDDGDGSANKEKNDETLDDLKELVLPTDRSDLTDFVEFVMNQLVVCRASEADVLRKSRRISLGFPGLCCGHCLASSGEGKYFFSSADSLCTAATVSEKHLLKCSAISSDMKATVVRYRARHEEQRRALPKGTLNRYFTRLWKRFRAAKNSGDLDRDMRVTVSTTSDVASGTGSPSSAGGDDGEPGGCKSDDGSLLEFTDHVSLLEFIKKTSPWNEDSELQDAIAKYYDCVATGGKIYNTNAMPYHFSSEWLLAKLSQLEKYNKEEIGTDI